MSDIESNYKSERLKVSLYNFFMMFRSAEVKDRYRKEVAASKYLKQMLELLLREQVSNLLEQLGGDRTRTHFANFVYGLILRTMTEFGLKDSAAKDSAVNFFANFFSNGERKRGVSTYTYRISGNDGDKNIIETRLAAYELMGKFLKKECELDDLKKDFMSRLFLVSLEGL